jgi:colanic acid biosynthesis glycosyl transferase WcaI
MRFLILTQYFPPEIGGAQTRLYSIAAELRRMGHEVEIVTAMPNYPKGRVFPGYEGCFYRREVCDGNVIHRVWIYPATGRGFQRMLNYASFTLFSIFGIFRARKPDYIFVESPPLFLSASAWLAGLVWRAPFIFNVADLWPDVALESGHIQDGFLVRCMAAIEKWSYKKAAYVSAVTEGIRESLLTRKSVPSEKLLFLPNGADTLHFAPRPPDTLLKRQLGLEGKKVVLWAGTLGPAHGIEYILGAAKLLEEHREIHFLFVGDGSERRALEQKRDLMRLSNVTFLDAVSIDRLPPYYSIAEVGLSSLTNIPLHNGARPSKILPVLASGKPLIFAGCGETARLIERANAGIVVPPENSEILASAILQLLGNPGLTEELGRNARQFVEANFQWSQLIANWITQFESRSSFPSRTTASEKQTTA